MIEVTATIVLESPLPLTATDKESPKRPWFLYALSLGVCVCLTVLRTIGTFHYSMERERRQPRKREKAHSPLRRACSTPGSTVSWKIGHDMILYKIQRYHFWGHFLGPLSGMIFWDHCLGAFSGTIFWEHFPGPFSGSIAGTIFWDPSLENETYHVFFMTCFWPLHCEGFSSS